MKSPARSLVYCVRRRNERLAEELGEWLLEATLRSESKCPKRYFAPCILAVIRRLEVRQVPKGIILHGRWPQFVGDRYSQVWVIHKPMEKIKGNINGDRLCEVTAIHRWPPTQVPLYIIDCRKFASVLHHFWITQSAAGGSKHFCSTLHNKV